jgi:uncharacterized protein with HEPN domain
MQRDALFLQEIVDAAARIVELTAGATIDHLNTDRDRRESLLWSFTVLGEACTQLSRDMKEAHPEVPWRAPSDLRNRIVHGYWQLSPDILLATGQDDMPAFLDAVRRVQREMGGEP